MKHGRGRQIAEGSRVERPFARRISLNHMSDEDWDGNAERARRNAPRATSTRMSAAAARRKPFLSFGDDK